MIGDAVTQADLEYKKTIDLYIQENGLEQNIFALGFRHDVADILALTDCVLIPSSEGLSLVALEAMSAKTHVVCTDGSGSAELLKVAGCGVTYKTNGSVEDIADVIFAVKKESGETLDNGYCFCLKQNYENYKKNLNRIFV